MLSRIKTQKRVFWINPNLGNTADVLPTLPLGFSDVEQADYLWDRARLLLKNLFPELESTQGIVESPLCRVPEIRAMLLPEYKLGSEWNLKWKFDTAARLVRQCSGKFESDPNFPIPTV